MSQFWFKRSMNMFVPISKEGWIMTIICWAVVLGSFAYFFSTDNDSNSATLKTLAVAVPVVIVIYIVASKKRDRSKDLIKPSDPLSKLTR